MPVKIARRTDRKIELLFIGLHPAFSACLTVEVLLLVLIGKE